MSITRTSFDPVANCVCRVRCPESQSSFILSKLSWLYNDIAQPIYQAGFAVDQSVYEKAVSKLFEQLALAAALLKDKR
jgi:glutathionyl-hydroquinone reductase